MTTPVYSDPPFQRTVFIYGALSLAAVAMGLIWGAIFYAAGLWPILPGLSLVIAAGLIGLLVIQRKHLHQNRLLMLQLGYLALIVYFCLYIDIPTPSAPRISHQFLLVLGIAGYIDYIRQKSLAQVLILLACGISFVLFVALQNPLSVESPIPDEIRAIGIWFNAITVVLLIAICIYVLRREFVRDGQILRDLQIAMRRDQLTLAFQPQVNAKGRLIGAEVLMRWTHPTRGPISPAIFIALAEEGDLMPELGRWVLRKACETLAAWQIDPDLKQLDLAINVSARQFVQPDFVAQVSGIVRASGASPKRIKLELTESVALSSLELVKSRMQSLADLGIRFSLDDFGTGYSSLNYLRNLPVQEIKIDRSFTNEAREGSRSGSLIRSIIQIGHDLELVVLAEGVETHSQFEYLKGLGCQEFQGFYFGAALSHDEFTAKARLAARPDCIWPPTT
ncbi:EAL domain-containing protein [Peteryoungia desertarenae]|uniref:EAL domain-containing protein n=1 Tax=Peteryoungia desertarenae TaxID=1813451 RepID=A0ABX6QPT2_9HYPH|nr:EAL domain-containing protein [Peteryoungia desertarenae]QLF70528.1 EAL domain-containing protein [Peteryoungia desertarenae]